MLKRKRKKPIKELSGLKDKLLTKAEKEFYWKIL